jgi:uncharacterized coiled-coil protein SlyX
MASLKGLEERIEALEEDSHPPVGWEEKIRRLEAEMKHLYEKLEKYGI